jgi:hypothetical protein
MDIAILVLVCISILLLFIRINEDYQGRKAIMGQYEDLKATIAQVGVDLGEAVGRVEAKIASLGDPDPDLTADIEALRSVSTQLDALAADPAPTPPTPEPVPPAPAPPVPDADGGDGTTDGGTPTNGGATV